MSTRISQITTSKESAEQWAEFPLTSTYSPHRIDLLERATELIALIDQIGTGGRIDVNQLHAHPTTGGVSISFALPRAYVAPRVQSAAQDLALVRAALSFNVSELALIFDVSRPTIYSWIEGTIPRRRHTDRLRLLVRVAEHWNRLSQLPMGSMRAPLVELLSSGTFNEDALIARLTGMAEAQAAAEPAHEGFAQRALRRHGMKVRRQGDEAIRRVTGSPAASD